MSSAQDPFYIVKEEIQDSIDKFLQTFHKWERMPSDSGERIHLTKEVLTGSESIEWQVDELDKAITVASRNPALYGIDQVELDNRRRWTSNARNQVKSVKNSVVTGKELNDTSTSNFSEMRRELMRLPNPHHADQSQKYSADNDDFISSESDRQLLLMRQQDEELDELSNSVQRIGGVGLTIHEELLAQEKIVDELGMEMDGTSNRLDFVQGLVRYRTGPAYVVFHICRKRLVWL